MVMNNLTVIGIGKIGLCSALVFERNGYNVLGVDINENHVKNINNKSLLSYEPKVNEYLQKSTNFRATTNLEDGLNHSNIIFIIIHTPNAGGDRYYDHTVLSNLLLKINSYKVKNKILITCCTVMPQYVDNIGKMMINDCENTTLNYVPEFIAQGNIIKLLEEPDMIMIGAQNKNIGEKISKVYKTIIKNNPNIFIMTPLEAEVAKISLNGFITTKISYANNISEVCDNLNINSKIVLQAIGSDKRIGNSYFNPGLSYGGPCFPRDTEALQTFLDKNDIPSDLIKSVRKMNDLHNYHNARKLLKENRKNYILEDVCFKDNCELPLIEESAKLIIGCILVKNGKIVTIKDKKHIINEVKKEYGNIFEYEIKE